ncbi:tyrosine-type recombinase/integrase [Ralstonia sp. ASV6]|uniref:tyrosine-type recombinase/integrase n=1 Tax=Ralstonia sp. ASV6 TaxID=2795124 RepID=UPI0018ED5D1C|nr:tyrosine-type recombinase/integrase [Ralstonia sp. ASV6]
MPISLPTGVHLRGSTYHLRIGVPDDIRHLWPHRSNGSHAIDAFRASLRTSDRNEAATRAHRIIAEFRERFDALRREAAPKTVQLTARMADHLAHEIERRLLQVDDLATATKSRQELHNAVGIQFVVDDGANEQFQIASLVAEQLGEALALGDLSYAEEFAYAELRDLGIVVDLSSTHARMALLRMQRAAIKAWRSIAARAVGEPIDTPNQHALPLEGIAAMPEKETGCSSTLRDILPRWQARTAAKPNAIARMTKALALFEEAVGIVPLQTLNKTHGAAFVRFLSDSKSRGFAQKTAHNHASNITALMNVADREGIIDRNPFDLTIEKTAGSQKREPWTTEELAAMFTSSLFSCAIPDDYPTWREVAPQDGRALLLLLIHTGARIGEIAQLRGEDFVVRNGITAIRITAEAGTLKTAPSERVVPLADQLLQDQWFATWLQNARKTTGPIMPSMHGRTTTPSDVAGRWFRAFREVVGLPNGGLNGAHKFRHWLRTALAENHVAVEVADQITGHSAKGSAGRVIYTGNLSLLTLKKALDRLPFPDCTSSSAQR